MGCEHICIYTHAIFATASLRHGVLEASFLVFIPCHPYYLSKVLIAKGIDIRAPNWRHPLPGAPNIFETPPAAHLRRICFHWFSIGF